MQKNKNTQALPSAPASFNRLNSIIRGHFYALVFLLPLIFFVHTNTVFTVPKLLLLQILTFSTALFYLSQFFVAQKFTWNFSKLQIPLVFWLFSLLLSTLFTINLNTSLFGEYGRFLGLFTMLLLLGIPFLMQQVFQKQHLQKLFFYSLCSGALVALYGLAQYLDVTFPGLNWFEWLLGNNYQWTDSPQNRVFATIGHANHLGAYLASQICLLLFFPSPSKPSSSEKLLKSLLFLLFLIVLVLTASRGALLALIITLIVLGTTKFFLFFKANYSGLKKRITAKALIFLPFILILGTLLLVTKPLYEDLNIFKRTESTIASLEKGYVPERLSFIYSALAMFKDHPLTGTGLSTFRDAYNFYRRTDYLIDGPGNAQYITVPEAAHNEPVNILATQGLIGFLAYFSILIAFVLALFKALKKSENQNTILAVLGLILVYFIQTLFNFGDLTNLVFFYIAIGCALVVLPNQSKNFTLPFVLRILITILGVWACSFGLLQMAIPLAKSDFFQKQAVVMEKQQPQLADQYWKIALRNYPYDYQVFQNYGDFLMQTGPIQNSGQSKMLEYLEQSVQNYRHALELNDHYSSTWHNLGLANLQIYRINREGSYLNAAKEAYQKSLDRAPNNPRYLYEFARKLHSDWNDKVTAVRLLKQALELAPGYREPQDYLNFLYKNHPELTTL